MVCYGSKSFEPDILTSGDLMFLMVNSEKKVRRGNNMWWSLKWYWSGCKCQYCGRNCGNKVCPGYKCFKNDSVISTCQVCKWFFSTRFFEIGIQSADRTLPCLKVYADTNFCLLLREEEVWVFRLFLKQSAPNFVSLCFRASTPCFVSLLL